jgi:glycosyltransferase involved in cell wall biosynthesis
MRFDDPDALKPPTRMRRRVLFVDHMPVAGGSQLVLLAHIRALDKTKFEVHVACTDSVPALVARLSEAGARTHVIPMPRLRELSPAILPRVFQSVVALRKLIKEAAIDVVVCNTTRATYLAAAAMLGTATPVIWWVRDFLYPRRAFRVLRRIPARIVYVSRALRNFYGDAQESRALVWPVASDLHEKLTSVTADVVRAERARHGLSPDDFVVGFMGRLVEEKGAADVIDSVAKLATDHPRLRLLIVGSGKGQANDAEARLRSMVVERGLESVVRFAGFQWNEALYYSMFDVFVLATRDVEGYPTSVVQAMMAGKAVIASWVGGTPEIVRHMETGLLYEPGNVGALETALRMMASDPSLRQKLATAGRSAVMANNREDQLTGVAERLYAEVSERR